MDAPRLERLQWDNFTEGQRNCLIWPDFIEWGPEQDVEVERTQENEDLGIITVAVQEAECSLCYNIIKVVKEGKPADGKVCQFDWITAVDGKPTTKVNGSGLVECIKNGKDKVCLTIRRANRPLKSIKIWSNKKINVKVEASKKNPGFRLAHFYCKGKNDNIEDHILMFSVHDNAREEGLPLSRGDELLSVNGTAVAGKKLQDVYRLIFEAAKADLEIQEILKGKELKDTLKKTALKSPEQIFWSQEKQSATIVSDSSEGSLGFTLISARKSGSENEVFHIVREVSQDTPAFKAKLSRGFRLLSVNGQNLTSLEKTEASALIKNQKGKLSFMMTAPEGIKQKHVRRRSSVRQPDEKAVYSQRSAVRPVNIVMASKPGRRDAAKDGRISESIGSESSGVKEPLSPVSPSGSRKKKSLIPVIDDQCNEAYCSSDGQNNIDICKPCSSKRKARLPEDKLQWSWDNLDYLTHKAICKRLDSDVYECDVKTVAAAMGFSQTDIKHVCQMHKERGGFGAAAQFMANWTKREKTNNVGKFREIVENEKYKRQDIIDIINEWLAKDVCWACGCQINNQ